MNHDTHWSRMISIDKPSNSWDTLQTTPNGELDDNTGCFVIRNPVELNLQNQDEENWIPKVRTEPTSHGTHAFQIATLNRFGEFFHLTSLGGRSWLEHQGSICWGVLFFSVVVESSKRKENQGLGRTIHITCERKSNHLSKTGVSSHERYFRKRTENHSWSLREIGSKYGYEEPRNPKIGNQGAFTRENVVP